MLTRPGMMFPIRRSGLALGVRTRLPLLLGTNLMAAPHWASSMKPDPHDGDMSFSQLLPGCRVLLLSEGSQRFQECVAEWPVGRGRCNAYRCQLVSERWGNYVALSVLSTDAAVSGSSIEWRRQVPSDVVAFFLASLHWASVGACIFAKMPHFGFRAIAACLHRS